MTNAKEARRDSSCLHEFDEAEEQINALLIRVQDQAYRAGYSAASLEWSSEPPSEPGWFFYRFMGEVSVECVIHYPSGFEARGVDVDGYIGEWAGPIPLPTERIAK
jgi:hypothetical protein